MIKYNEQFNPFFDKTINKICIYYFYSYISAHTVYKDLGTYMNRKYLSNIKQVNTQKFRKGNKVIPSQKFQQQFQLITVAYLHYYRSSLEAQTALLLDKWTGVVDFLLSCTQFWPELVSRIAVGCVTVIQYRLIISNSFTSQI